MRPILRTARITPKVFLGVVLTVSMISTASGAPLAAQEGGPSSEPIRVTLDQALAAAMESNRQRPASRYAVESAESLHRQALAAYWPHVQMQGGYQRLASDPNYLFPANEFGLPMGGSLPISIPGIGTVPLESFSIPAQDIQLMDRESFRAAVSGGWLLYDGGMRRGLREQSSAYVDAMREEARRTDLQIVDAVTRFYYGAVLAAQLHQLGMDSLERMEATLDLTETMFTEGSGSVTRSDWLDNRIMVESLRSMVSTLEKNEQMAQAALANSMGLAWDRQVRPADHTLPFEPFSGSLDDLVARAFRFSPDWMTAEAGRRAAEGALQAAQSGIRPRLGLSGEWSRWWNDYTAGMATDVNKRGWSVELGVEAPLFNGFLTRNRVAESRARLARIEEQQTLLRDGLGLQIRDAFLALEASERSYEASQSAMQASIENRDLNTRAYQAGLVGADKVIRSQLVEALMTARYHLMKYEHVTLLSKLDLLVGNEMEWVEDGQGLRFPSDG